ncbi:S-adenosyl-l-methionine hydroxide adenosyltransferase [Candidatus Kryptonium thompsonii]|nr:S-adenosyl-l-methionine hydroxide adenosyltransferase [Candidatus Kryptonium thompsoni]
MFIEIQGEGSYKGKVIYIDRFGNLITNLRASGEINGEVNTDAGAAFEQYKN